MGSALASGCFLLKKTFPITRMTKAAKTIVMETVSVGNEAACETSGVGLGC